jgi:RNA polymerase sigma factor (TIGR02999 family)
MHVSRVAVGDVNNSSGEGSPNDAATAAQLLPRVYEQLRRQARQYLRNERKGHTLTATALVHEAYVRLIGKGEPAQFGGRAQFFVAAAQAMRKVLIDHARAHRAEKRGGNRRRVPLHIMDVAADLFDPGNFDDILALDDAISRLELQDEQAASVVRLRFYAGLSIDEAAEVLAVSPRTVKRNWEYARGWLYRELTEE